MEWMALTLDFRPCIPVIVPGYSPTIHYCKFNFEIRSDEFLRDDIVSNIVNRVFCCSGQQLGFVEVFTEHILLAGTVGHKVEIVYLSDGA